MNCPSCNQPASSFLRSSFTFQGVSFFKNVQGYLKCQCCSALLRVTGFGRAFWPFYIGMVVVLLLWIALYRNGESFFGLDVGTLWVIIGLLFIVTFRFYVWPNAQVEMVTSNEGTSNNPSANSN